MEEKRLQAKDFITLGIYNVIFVFIMLVAGITNLTPYTYLFYPFTGALLGSFVFLLALIKVPKKGTVILMSLGLIIYLFLTGVQGMVSAISILIFAVLAEFVLGDDRKNGKRIIIAYMIYSCWMAIGGEFRFFVFPDSYFTEALNSGLDPAYVEILRSMSIWWWWLISSGVGILGAFLGMLLANCLLKKHLKRAGIV